MQFDPDQDPQRYRLRPFTALTRGCIHLGEIVTWVDAPRRGRSQRTTLPGQLHHGEYL